MSSFLINSIQTPPPAAAVQQIDTPRPPKSQSDHQPAHPVTSSRGPAVVLSGALARTPDRHGQQAQSDGQHQSPPQATGQRINHVI